jgi:predicted CoA-binding protein
MTSRRVADDFVYQRKLAVVGASRKKLKLGNLAFRELKRRGYKLFPVHSHAETNEGERCYRSLTALSEPADGALVIVPAAQAEQVVRNAAAAWIRRVWLQQGAESPAAIRLFQESGTSAVHGECVLTFAAPAAKHHRAHG